MNHTLAQWHTACSENRMGEDELWGDFMTARQVRPFQISISSSLKKHSLITLWMKPERIPFQNQAVSVAGLFRYLEIWPEWDIRWRPADERLSLWCVQCIENIARFHFSCWQTGSAWLTSEEAVCNGNITLPTGLYSSDSWHLQWQFYISLRTRQQHHHHHRGDRCWNVVQ